MTAGTASLLAVVNRIMHTIGATARKLKLLQADVILGFSFSLSGKSPAFDQG
ncbi:MAG: DUF2148 domain-containing protein [Candidatus Methylomirabilota bacterium]